MGCPACAMVASGTPARLAFIRGFTTASLGVVAERLRGTGRLRSTADVLEELIASFCDDCEEELAKETRQVFDRFSKEEEAQRADGPG